MQSPQRTTPNHRSALSSPFNRSLIGVIQLTLGLGLVFGCIHSQSQTTEITATPSEQATLSISVLPTQSKAEQTRMIAPLDAHLEKVLGQPVDFLIADSYQDNVAMLVDGRADAAYTGAVSYLEMEELGLEVTPIVAAIDKFSGRPWYRACIVVKANSNIQTLEDLKGKRVAFVNPSSTSGYLMPYAALQALNIDPQRDFAAVIFGGTYTETEALLETGKVDAIATNIPSYTKRQQLGKLTPNNARILWRSEPIPHSPLVVKDSLSPEVIDKLKEAFLTMPPGIEDIVSTQASGYTLMVASDYDPIRRIRNQLGIKINGMAEVSE